MKCNGSPRHEVNLHERRPPAEGMYYKAEEWGLAYEERKGENSQQSNADNAPQQQQQQSSSGPSAPTDTVKDTSRAAGVMNQTKMKLIKSIADRKQVNSDDLAAAMCAGKKLEQCSESDGDTLLAALNSL